MDLSAVYKQVLKSGLRQYKYRNSKLKPVGVAEGNKGSIFGFRTKELMVQSRGIVLTSEESVRENENQFTHWTPNIFRYGTYTDENRQFVKGHSENNLRQINTFVVDIDVREKFNHGEIVLAAYDRLGFMPTMILDTPGGFQAYFVLESPAFVTKKSNFRVIDVAKRISENIRKQLALDLQGVDLGCNHFGIARIPRSDNVLFYEESYTYSFQEWLNWSMKNSDDKKASVIPFPQKNEIRQIDEKWVDLLMNSEKLKGSKGVLGRNNAIFTLCLAYFSSKSDVETCEYNIFMLNERLKHPLKETEIKRIIKSAYSGEYQAASKDYIREICQEWIDPNLSDSQLFSWPAGWYKFKKERTERVRSHSKEWQQDILEYLSTQSYTYKPFIYSTKREIREEIGVPERSFDAALKQLKETNQVFYSVMRGRGGGIMIASVKALLRTIILTKKDVREAYFEAIRDAFVVQGSFIQHVFEQLLPVKRDFKEIELIQPGAG